MKNLITPKNHMNWRDIPSAMNKDKTKQMSVSGDIVSHVPLRWEILKIKDAQGFPRSSPKHSSFNIFLRTQVFLSVSEVMINLIYML
jgi:hypothetical protein